MCVVSPCVFTSCAVFWRACRARLEQIQIYSNFSRIKNWHSCFRFQNFGGSRIKPINLTHMLIINLSHSKRKKNLSRIATQERILFSRRSFAFWSTLALLVLWSHNYVPQIDASITVPKIRVTDIWRKAELKFVSLQRKGSDGRGKSCLRAPY